MGPLPKIYAPGHTRRKTQGSSAVTHRGNSHVEKETLMLKWALIFALVSMVAALFGFTGLAAGAADIAKVLFFIFVVLCGVFLTLGLFVFKALK